MNLESESGTRVTVAALAFLAALLLPIAGVVYVVGLELAQSSDCEFGVPHAACAPGMQWVTGWPFFACAIALGVWSIYLAVTYRPPPPGID